jgi:type IV pilus assembly protein PilQ
MNAKNAEFGALPLARAGSVCAVCAALVGTALGQVAGGGERQTVEMTDYGTVTLAVQDTDLAQVLEMLAIQSQKNIITSKNVSATISANLFDVTFHEALDSILKVNGYDYLEEGNFIYIYTLQELDEIKKANQKREARTFELNYLSASDAHELIAPLLSEVGTSSFRGDVEPGIEPDASNVGRDDWAYSAMLVVNDYAEVLERIASLLSELDTPPRQVLIEATVLQTTLDESNAYGVDFSVLADVDFTDLTAPLEGVTNLLSGNDATTGFQPADNEAIAIGSTVGQTAGAGGFKIGVLTDEIAVFLKLLDEVTNSTVLARPKIMCINRQRAEVLVGSRVGYLSTTATQTSTTQTVEFLDTGIHLMFRPFIANNGMIRLELSPSVSEASLRTVTDAQGIAVTIPDELTNELTTNVRVQDGHTLVLGGLFRESTRVTRRQVPFLGDIPIVGAAFKGQDDTVDRNEIMFLITPSIVHDESLWAMGEDALSYSEDLRVGARMGLLPFSLERTTNNYNNRAVQAFKRGDLENAERYVNTSLRLNANQPEMVRFRSSIMGMRDNPHERSMLEKVFRAELGELFPQQTTNATPVAVGGAVPVPFGADQMAAPEFGDEMDAQTVGTAEGDEFDWWTDENLAAPMTEPSDGMEDDAFFPENPFGGAANPESPDRAPADPSDEPQTWSNGQEPEAFAPASSTARADEREPGPITSPAFQHDIGRHAAAGSGTSDRFGDSLMNDAYQGSQPTSSSLAASKQAGQWDDRSWTAAPQPGNEDAFVDFFVREYFTSLGLAQLASFPATGSEQAAVEGELDDESFAEVDGADEPQ